MKKVLVVLFALISISLGDQTAYVSVKKDELTRDNTLKYYLAKVEKLCEQNRSWKCIEVKLHRDARTNNKIEITIPDQSLFKKKASRAKALFETLMRK